MWKNIVDSEDLRIYERKYKKFLVRIEARLSDNDKWNVFKKYCTKDNLNHVENYQVSGEELGFMMKSLMKKSYSTRDLERIKLESSKVPRINFRRDFKEYCMEKWKFSIDSEPSNNLLFIKYDDVIELDIIAHKRFKAYKDNIIDEVSSTFNLDKEDADVVLNVFFYDDSSSEEKTLDKADMLLGKLEIGFENNEQD